MPKEISRSFEAYTSIVVGEDFNSRNKMGDLDGLAQVIDAHGLLQPMVVREGGPSRTEPGKRSLFLVAGERRYRAIGLLRDPNWASKDADGKPYKRRTTPASWNQVEVKLVKGDTQQIAELNFIENLHREPLEALEEAEAMKRYMEKYHCSQAQLAKHIGKSEPYVSQRLALLKKITPETKKAMEAGKISATHAREMVTLTPEQQNDVLEKVEKKQKEKPGKKVSVQDVRREADKHKAANKRAKDPEKYDKEKVAAAKEIFDGKELSVRPKQAFLELVGALQHKIERASNPEKVAEYKSYMKCIEWAVGARETLIG